MLNVLMAVIFSSLLFTTAASATKMLPAGDLAKATCKAKYLECDELVDCVIKEMEKINIDRKFKDPPEYGMSYCRKLWISNLLPTW